MVSPRKDPTISTSEQRDASEKVELEAPSNCGETLPHSSCEHHFEETNSNIPSSKEPQATDIYSIARDRSCRIIRKIARYTADDESGLITYALAITKEIGEGIEPSSYSETIFYPNSSNCPMAMQEERKFCRKMRLGSYVNCRNVIML